MKARREDHQDAARDRALRRLEELGRRWPVAPGVYLIAVAIVALVLLLLAIGQG